MSLFARSFFFFPKGEIMATLNRKEKTPAIHTHEGGKAKHVNHEAMLRRSVMSCLLWENEFYEDGVTIADRIAELIPKISTQKVCDLAIEARQNMKLRHVPLWVLRCVGQNSPKVIADVLPKVIQRPDELGEFLALWNKDKRHRIPRSIRRGLTNALRNFNEYSLAKFDKNSAAWSLRDVLRIIHAMPKNEVESSLWKKIAKGELATPDTWETALSAGADKKETFTRLIEEKKLGALALLRNLRNMTEAKVSDNLIRQALNECSTDKVLPFRFIAAARYAPRFESELEEAMKRSIIGLPKLAGSTVVLVDVSGSMDAPLSNRSEMQRIDAASGLAVLVRELCENVVVYTFSSNLVEVPTRRGFALVEAIKSSQAHGATELGKAITQLNKKTVDYDRLIVITDEQSCQNVSDPVQKLAYGINVASYRNGVTYGKWTHIDGWSDSVVTYIQNLEEESS